MLVEIGLIQRIGVFLGHPVYGLAIGLFGIILSTGVGSLLASRVRLLSDARILLWSAILGVYLVGLPLWFPLLSAEFASADLAARAAVSLIALVPSGILMGFGFPTGMEIVNAIDSRPTPWFWAVNGAAGVLASGLARRAQHCILDQRDALGRCSVLSPARPSRDGAFRRTRIAENSAVAVAS